MYCAACAKKGSYPATPVPAPTPVTAPVVGSNCNAPSPACVAAACCPNCVNGPCPAMVGANLLTSTGWPASCVAMSIVF